MLPEIGAKRKDPATENYAMMYGRPVKAFAAQDHDAHIAAHSAFMRTRMVQINPPVYANLQGLSTVEQVAGPDFMPLCMSAFPNAKHYFYGSTQLTLEKLRENLILKYPGISIV